jgi:RNA polymerase sigma-70 factor (ECF subfamily)
MVEVLTPMKSSVVVGPTITVPLSPVSAGKARFDPLAMLLAEIATGNERAFARLFELSGSQLLSVARGIVWRTDLAEDVLQESFLRIWRSAHQYNPDKGSGHAWLVTIVRNRALSAKAQLRRHESGRDDLDFEKLVFNGPDPAAQAMRSEEARRVRTCLGNLPANHRKSVALVYFEGLTHKELARRLDVQLGTAKSWVRRGLSEMTRCLTGSASKDWREMVAAEYAVGSLQGAARCGFERRRERDARYCRAADVWEAKLALLTEFLPEKEPPPAQVWKRIQQDVKSSRLSSSRAPLWQTTAGILAIVIVLLLVVLGALTL